jgi:hypothetical protein
MATEHHSAETLPNDGPDGAPHRASAQHPPPPTPSYRRLRSYSLDPSLNSRLDTAVVNQTVLEVPWEIDSRTGTDLLLPGPVGEYLAVVDYDPASQAYYEPVDLNHPHLISQDGLTPSEGNPQFHQQMVYAVAMKTINNFERALGRRTLWNDRGYQGRDSKVHHEFIRRLHIYPHALREANAYYSKARKALLFGYFLASTSEPGDNLPGGTVFTCLSHDIIAHETTHALVDGMHPYFAKASNVDVLALHEALADIVALFQHFTYRDVLRHQIARTRGSLEKQNLLGQLAHQFGQAIGSYGALRDSLGEIDPVTKEWRAKEPDPHEIHRAVEPHRRGAILVAAMFDAFLTIYKARIEDLLRIATGGSGILPEGEIHPDLVNRLAGEAAKSARHVLRIAIRALDYCPPVDITFGDYLRALITADVDLEPEDPRGYRIAFIESFRRRGIYPEDVSNLSVESLRWRAPEEEERAQIQEVLGNQRKHFNVLCPEWGLSSDRHEVYEQMKRARRWLLSRRIYPPANGRKRDVPWKDGLRPAGAKACGITLKPEAPWTIHRESGVPQVHVHSVRPTHRIRPSGEAITDLVVEITQWRQGFCDPDEQRRADRAGKFEKRPYDFAFRGGCTLLVDLEHCRVRYCISKSILSEERLEVQRRFVSDPPGLCLHGTYFQDDEEPFALVHRAESGLEEP